jgi:hypothetical protein
MLLELINLSTPRINQRLSHKIRVFLHVRMFGLLVRTEGRAVCSQAQTLLSMAGVAKRQHAFQAWSRHRSYWSGWAVEFLWTSAGRFQAPPTSVCCINTIDSSSGRNLTPDLMEQGSFNVPRILLSDQLAASRERSDILQKAPDPLLNALHHLRR